MKLQLIANIKAPDNAAASVSLGYLFTPGTEVTIGREIGNTIAPLVDSLSRHHAKLYAKDGEWFVEDSGSTNGSFLNGTKLAAPAKLESGVKLQFGTMTMSVELVSDAASGSTQQLPPVSELTPAQAAAAGAAAQAASPKPTIISKPTIPGMQTTVAEPGKPVLPTGAAPAPAPAPALAPAPAAAEPEVADIPDLPPVDLPPVEEEKKPAAPATAAPAASPLKAAAPALKPGIKLPPKPGLASGIKLPPKPGLASGIKLPPKPGLASGLKLPPKPGLASGLKLPPKPGIKLPPKP